MFVSKPELTHFGIFQRDAMLPHNTTLCASELQAWNLHPWEETLLPTWRKENVPHWYSGHNSYVSCTLPGAHHNDQSRTAVAIMPVIFCGWNTRQHRTLKLLNGNTVKQLQLIQTSKRVFLLVWEILSCCSHLHKNNLRLLKKLQYCGTNTPLSLTVTMAKGSMNTWKVSWQQNKSITIVHWPAGFN